MFIPFVLAGIGLGYFLDDEEKPNYPVRGNWEGPLPFRDYVTRTSWYNPVSGTNVDQYIIGGTILVLLYKLVK